MPPSSRSEALSSFHSARMNGSQIGVASAISAYLTGSLLRLKGAGMLRWPRGALHDGYVPLFTDDPAGRAVRFAYQQLGKTYKFAAEGPNAYDCSGLVMASWKQAGVVLPHNALRQYKTVKPITRAELKPGDLVFYYHDVSHVALYVGADRVIEAPQPGETISMRMIDFAPIVGYGRPQ